MSKYTARHAADLAHRRIDKLQATEDIRKLLAFLMSKDEIVDWTELPDEFSAAVLDACELGFVSSYVGTETYMITTAGKDVLNGPV
jgi:hypothetical protein